jgi:hypothetical protein
MQDLKQVYGDKILGTCTVEQAYGGMRSVKSMVYETSLLDPVEVGTTHSSHCMLHICMLIILVIPHMHVLTRNMCEKKNRVSVSAV